MAIKTIGQGLTCRTTARGAGQLLPLRREVGGLLRSQIDTRDLSHLLPRHRTAIQPLVDFERLIVTRLGKIGAQHI